MFGSVYYLLPPPPFPHLLHPEEAKSSVCTKKLMVCERVEILLLCSWVKMCGSHIKSEMLHVFFLFSFSVCLNHTDAGSCWPVTDELQETDILHVTWLTHYICSQDQMFGCTVHIYIP